MPRDASSLRLSLGSDKPAIDVGLFVRYEVDNDQATYDWSSRGISGNEGIVICRFSTPSLRPGRHLVSLLL